MRSRETQVSMLASVVVLCLSNRHLRTRWFQLKVARYEGIVESELGRLTEGG